MMTDATTQESGRWVTERTYAEIHGLAKNTLANWRWRDRVAKRPEAAPGTPQYRRFGRAIRYWLPLAPAAGLARDSVHSGTTATGKKRPDPKDVLDLLSSPVPGSGIVYFAAVEDRFVKIGYSARSDGAQGRVSQLSATSPFDLEILLTIPGKMATEKMLHDLFHPYWIRSEWFRLDGELKEFIRLARAKYAGENDAPAKEV